MKKLNFLYGLMLLTLPFVSVSCGDDEPSWEEKPEEPQYFTVSVESSEGGTATASENVVEWGNEVTLTATPNSGYVFIEWTENGEFVSYSNPAVERIVNNRTFKANFEKSYTATVRVDGVGGKATIKETGANNVEMTATADEGYLFYSWSLNDEVVSYKTKYETKLTNNSEFVATFVKINLDVTGSENGYNYVDLGLSVKWATCNVGATSPQESGDYYAWGETQPKERYSWATYQYCNGTQNYFTKYVFKEEEGSVDYKTTLELTDDAARENWGGNWRMPTQNEMKEFVENTVCREYQIGDKKGYLAISKKNENMIFIPYTGYKTDTGLEAEKDGLYWSSSLTNVSSKGAYRLSVSKPISSSLEPASVLQLRRNNGLAVRAVFE